METPILLLQKSAEKTTNKIRIPKKAIDTLGKNFCLEVYKDKIILRPTEKGE